MRRSALGGLLLVALVATGCGGEKSADGDRTPAPTVTATRTETATKSPPPPEPQRTVSPPESPVPEGPAGDCAHTDSRPAIERGAQGAAVQQAQCYLNLTTADSHIPEDGDFGPVTEQAVKKFQGCAGITVDGLVGPETWSYLTFWASSPSFLC